MQHWWKSAWTLGNIYTRRSSDNFCGVFLMISSENLPFILAQFSLKSSSRSSSELLSKFLQQFVTELHTRISQKFLLQYYQKFKVFFFFFFPWFFFSKTLILLKIFNSRYAQHPFLILFLRNSSKNFTWNNRTFQSILDVKIPKECLRSSEKKSREHQELRVKSLEKSWNT